VDLDDFQHVIDATFGDRDRARGVPSSVAWLAEEVGELAQAVRKGSHEQQLHEFADVLAWLTSLANQVGVNLSEAAQRYADGCPHCGNVPCMCE
jgi:NTP pyrophosphatase (non-canonical NTP hydrolase)